MVHQLECDEANDEARSSTVECNAESSFDDTNNTSTVVSNGTEDNRLGRNITSHTERKMLWRWPTARDPQEHRFETGGSKRRLSKTDIRQPGVEFVPWGPLGPPDHPQTRSMSSGLTTTESSQPQQEEIHLEWISMDHKGVFRARARKCLLGGIAVLVLVSAVAIGVGVTVSRTKTKARAGRTVMEPPTTDCALWFDHKQPNVVTQCTCSGRISVIANDVMTEYNKLVTEGFLKDLAPHFNSTMTSCIPANQALVWLASGSGTPTPEARVRQRYALALNYILWNRESRHHGSNGWLSAIDECKWSGIFCNVDGEVQNITLPGIQMKGTFGSEIALLTSLTALSLVRNELSGTLPTEIGNLPQLTSINLDVNNLNGTLPRELNSLSVLKVLSISCNKLSGTILTEFGALSNLDKIDLSNNTLTGTLPTEIGLWKASSITLSNNNFNSTIPKEIGMSSNLRKLQMISAGLTGTIPTEFFNASNLQSLSFSYNELSGTMPTYFGKLAYLEQLLLSQNRIIGMVPTEIGHCQKLVVADLSFNYLNGTIPDQLGENNADRLFLDGNQFSGPIPQSVCEISESSCARIMCECCICNLDFFK